MKSIKIIGKQPVSSYKVPAGNHIKYYLWVQAWKNTAVITHYWEVMFTEAHAQNTYSGVQKTAIFKSTGKADLGFSGSKFQQPFPYTSSPLTPAPWHGPPPTKRGKGSHHNKNLENPGSNLALRWQFRAVDQIIVPDTVHHTKELLVAKDLYLRPLFSGHRRTKVTPYDLYDFTRTKYFTYLENYYSHHWRTEEKKIPGLSSKM